MKYRILTALLLVAVLAVCYLVFGDGNQSQSTQSQGSSPSRPSQSQGGDNSLKGFKIP